MTSNTALKTDSLITDVEIEWGKQMQGELGLGEDFALRELVISMASYIINQREMVNAREEDCEPLAKQIVYAVQMLTSPEMNGA